MGVSRRVLISQFGNIAPGALTVPVTGARVTIGVGRRAAEFNALSSCCVLLDLRRVIRLLFSVCPNILNLFPLFF